MKQSAYIFDVDGVLNNPHDYEPDGRIIAHIAHLLDSGVFVAINTGRGYAWAEQDVVKGVQPKLQAPDSLSRLFISVEMGGLGVEFVGGAEKRTRSAFSLREDQIAAVRDVFDEHLEFADRIHWYPKETMATFDKNSAVTLDEFLPAQKELTAILRGTFKHQHIKIANSNDAIDIHAPEAGKWAGAQLIYDWLGRTTDIAHDHFICFGDSLVDYEMARFFAEQSHDTTFVFTGPSLDGIEPHHNIMVIQTTQPYNAGTYEYLKRLEVE